MGNPCPKKASRSPYLVELSPLQMSLTHSVLTGAIKRHGTRIAYLPKWKKKQARTLTPSLWRSSFHVSTLSDHLQSDTPGTVTELTKVNNGSHLFYPKPDHGIYHVCSGLAGSLLKIFLFTFAYQQANRPQNRLTLFVFARKNANRHSLTQSNQESPPLRRKQ